MLQRRKNVTGTDRLERDASWDETNTERVVQTKDYGGLDSFCRRKICGYKRLCVFTAERSAFSALRCRRGILNLRMRYKFLEYFSGHVDVVLRDVQGSHCKYLIESFFDQLFHQPLRETVAPRGVLLVALLALSQTSSVPGRRDYLVHVIFEQFAKTLLCSRCQENKFKKT